MDHQEPHTQSESFQSAQHTSTSNDHPNPNSNPSPSLSQNNTSNANYADLLTSITTLQSDLQKTLTYSHKLKRENVFLKENYDEMKTALIRTQKRYGETRSSLQEYMDKSTKREKNVEIVVEKWKAQLTSRTKELEEMQIKLQPQDMDMLRIQLQEELESGHRLRVESMEGEIDKWRQMFFRVRREYELCRTEFEQFSISSGNEIESAHEQRKEEVGALERQLVKAVKEEEERQREERGVEKEENERLRRKQEEQRVIEEELRKEISEVRSAKEREEVEKHEFITSNQSEIASLHSRCALLEADKDGYLRKISSLESEVVRLKGQAKEAASIAESCRADTNRAQKMLADREREVIETKAAGVEEIAKARRVFDLEREELQSALSSMRAAKGDAEQHGENLQTQLIEAKRKVALGEEKSKKEAREAVAKLKDQIEVLQSEVIRLEDSKKRNDVEYASNLQRVTSESETSKSNASRISREKEVIAARAAGFQDTIEALKHSLAESEAKKKADAKIIKEGKALCRDLERENSEIKSDKFELEKSVDILQEKVAKLSHNADRQREEHLIAINDMKKQIEADREKLKSRMKEETNKLKSKLAKEQKKSGAYKEKALEAHQRVVRTRSALSAASGNEMGL